MLLAMKSYSCHNTGFKISWVWYFISAIPVLKAKTDIDPKY